MGMVSTQLILGDCLEVMQGIEMNSIHSIVCDPPYGLSFMGKHWDHGVPGVAFWEAALRVAKPGAMLLAFGGTRTFHRLTVAIEDAGWEIRDCLMWVTGQGFPKSHDISKAIDKAAGAEREVVGTKRSGIADGLFSSTEEYRKHIDITAPATPSAIQWAGWGTALKPAWEPIIMAMKPLDGTFANNALVHGVAGLNIDACRIGTDEETGRKNKRGTGHGLGRWPANLLLDESAAEALDQMRGTLTSGGGNKSRKGNTAHNNCYGTYNAPAPDVREIDRGGASRFFYCAKASKRDRDEGLEGMEEREAYKMSGGECIAEGRSAAKGKAMARNFHPTVKPTQLMRYLVRLVTPANGVVLDPFMGSGSTGKAAVLEGFSFIGIDTEAEYLTIAERRIAHAQAQVETPTQAQPALLEVAGW